jgi:succinate dehydrogenase cytochrome b556 subunit
MRPVSPFLSVYKPQFGSISSIFGRITGLVLFFALVFILLIGDLSNSFLIESYFFYSVVFFVFKSKSLLSLSFILFVLCSLFYHLIFSIRYLYWSITGGSSNKFSLELVTLYGYSYVSLFLTFLITFIFCLVII